MTGLDGISSLKTVLGSLTAHDSTSATAATSAAQTAGASEPRRPSFSAGSVDTTKFSAASGLAATQDTSDVRLDKVQAIKTQIANGTYNVPASAVADKVISSLLQ